MYKLSLVVIVVLIGIWIIVNIISAADPNRVADPVWSVSDFVFPFLIFLFLFNLRAIRKKRHDDEVQVGWSRFLLVFLASSGIGAIVTLSAIVVSYIFIDPRVASVLFDNFVALFMIGFFLGLPISLRYAKW